MPDATTNRRRPRPLVLWAAAAAIVLVLCLGLFMIGVAAPSYRATIILGVGWVILVGLAAMVLARRRPGLRRVLASTFVVACAVLAAGFYWTSIRDDVVNEVVATGAAESSVRVERRPTAPVNVTTLHGPFGSLAHGTSGTASVVRLAEGGRVLTLTGFRTDNGPDLRVLLVAGPVDGDGDVSDAADLGRLKGNVGNQQYTIPPDADLGQRRTVVIWCRAFSVAFGRAELTQA